MTRARRTVLLRRSVASLLAIVLALPMTQVCEAAPLEAAAVVNTGVSDAKVGERAALTIERVAAMSVEAGPSGDRDVPPDSRGDCVCHCPCTCLVPAALPVSSMVAAAQTDMPHVTHVHSETAPLSITRSPLLRPPLA